MRFSILALCFLVSACSESKPEPPPKVVATTAPPAVTAPSARIDEEPPEDVLRELMFRQYDALEERGGLPATVTATGYTGTLHAKLYEVRKDKCVHPPVGAPGMYECGVSLMATLWWEGRPEPSKPLADNKRISVIRDDKGVWIDCTYNSDRDSICRRRNKK